LKKSPNDSRYGPFYYFTDLANAMRYACYNESNNERYEKGGLVRFILFPGKMKMFSQHDKIDTSEMAEVIFENDPSEKNTGQFRDNDCKWTLRYNSAYNGDYNIKLLNHLGQVIKVESNSPRTLNINQLEAGIYHLIINDGDQEFKKKIIKY